MSFDASDYRRRFQRCGYCGQTTTTMWAGWLPDGRPGSICDDCHQKEQSMKYEPTAQDRRALVDAVNQIDAHEAERKRQSTTDTAPTTFEPDWDKIYEAWLQENDDEYNRSYALPIVITEYQRQMAEAGYVVVRRDDVAKQAEQLRSVASDRLLKLSPASAFHLLEAVEFLEAAVGKE